MILFPDIATIVAQYLPPSTIRDFLVQHQIPNKCFVYNYPQCDIMCETFNPNMIIKSINHQDGRNRKLHTLAYDIFNPSNHMKVTSATTIILSGTQSILDMSFLRTCPRIRHLTIYDYTIPLSTNSPNLPLLSTLFSIRKLYPPRQYLDNLSKHRIIIHRLNNLSYACSYHPSDHPFKVCIKLKSISFKRCLMLEMPDLTTCVYLRRLRVAGCNEIVSISSGPNVRNVIIRFCYNLLTLNGLKSCTKLRYIEIRGCWALCDITALESCTSLQEISIIDCSEINNNSTLNYLKRKGVVMYVYN